MWNGFRSSRNLEVGALVDEATHPGYERIIRQIPFVGLAHSLDIEHLPECRLARMLEKIQKPAESLGRLFDHAINRPGSPLHADALLYPSPSERTGC